MFREGPEVVQMQSFDGHGGRVEKDKLSLSNDNNYYYLSFKANVGVKGGGKWYHEVTLGANQQILIGFCTQHCMLDPNNGDGLGHDEKSWGWDGYSAQKCYAGKSENYGERSWKVGDVIGVLLDLDARRISYSKNGKTMGPCFTDVPKDQFLYPAISLKRYQKVTYNFGATAFKFPDKIAFPLHVSLNAKQKDALEKLFEHYQKIGTDLSESQEDRGDICKADGVFQFATDLGAKDDSDPLLLVVAYRLGAEKPWEFTRNEWVRGFSLCGLSDIAGIKTAAAKWKKEVMEDNEESFKPFYAWCFDYLREDRRVLSAEEVKTLWNMLGMAGRWKLWGKWLEYLFTKKKREYMSRDEWCVTLTFAQEHKNSIDNYDADGAWPVLIDDFVRFINGEEDD